ncbi:small gtpase rab7 [Stylonychia lemnae]|uniref:Small gtpase rab7 n=1 Tax=Stylonychia lemnae TaxID=5949 RepID=A0A077ZX76_STYLE|nr:small gtpase rab7 [Stylonychia lemnae]|eukprot:CDW74490.1 small gtpase rab7 [Stylonychia lemnae]
MSRKDFLKIIIIGDQGVGKTSLLEAYTLNGLSQHSKPTIGAEFKKKVITLGDSPTPLYKGVELNLQIWDTAGQERFSSLSTQFYRGSDCCILAFDLTNKESYDHLHKWIDVVQETTGDQGIPIILVGNKCDKINERSVSNETIQQQWVQSNKVQQYIEASATKFLGLEQLFHSAGYYGLVFSVKYNSWAQQQSDSNCSMSLVETKIKQILSSSTNITQERADSSSSDIQSSQKRIILNKKQLEANKEKHRKGKC